MIPVEEEGEERTGDEKRSEEEEVEVEEQSERDEEEEEEGMWQREEPESEVIEQMDRETESGLETQKVRDVAEEKKTADSDKIMKRYRDQLKHPVEEEEQSERDEVGEMKEREDSDAVGEKKEVEERCRKSSEEHRDDADEYRSEGEEKTSLRPCDEGEGIDKESKVTTVSESEEEEIEQLENIKENTNPSLPQKHMMGKKKLSRCDRLPSEVRSVTFDPTPQALMFFRSLQA